MMNALLQKLQHPGIIFYWPYVLSALLITIFYLIVERRMALSTAVRTIFAKKVWLTRSTLTDFSLSAGYALALSAPAAAFHLFVFNRVSGTLHTAFFGEYRFVWAMQMHPALEGLGVAMVAMLSIDFATYVVHRFFHSSQWLWDLHAVHHSAEQLTFLTTHRQHPLEPFILNACRGAFAAIGVAMFYFVFPAQTPAMLIMGMGAGFFVYMFTVNLQHSHVPVRYPRWLRYFVMSPHMHHIHHSAALQHRNKNFGVIFSFWDRLFGTYLDADVALGELQFGLDRDADPFQHSLLRCVFYPLYSPVARILKWR